MQGPGQGVGDECVMGTEVQFGRMESSGEGGGGGCPTAGVCLRPLSYTNS